MKLINLLAFILLLIHSIFSWAASYGVNPSVVSTGQSFEVYANADGALPSPYKIKVSFDNGVVNFPLGGGPQNWSKSFSSSSIGQHTVYFKLFNDTVFVRNITSRTYTINPSVLNPPAGVSATDGSYTDKIIVSWNSVADASSYKVYRSQYSSSNYQYLSTDTSSPYYDTSATVGINYYYKLKAYNSSSGDSALSSSYDLGYKKVPTVNSVSVNPSSGQAGSNFRFYVFLSGSLPSGYTVQREIYDGGWKFRTSMTAETSTKYYNDKVITLAGSRQFRVAIFNGSTLVSAWKEGAFNVTAIPVNHAPTVSKYSAPTSSKVGESVVVKVTAIDSDNNLSTVQINWGDAGNTADFCTKYSGNIFQCTHTYQSVATYTWAVKAYDNGSPILTSGSVQGSISVQPEVDIVSFLSQDLVIGTMSLASKLSHQLSRSDAVVLIDRMRILENSSLEKGMLEYLNPFADVPDDAEYAPSLMRLAYYRSSSFSTSPINKYNDLFNPLTNMTREEFLAVAMASFNIPKQVFSLATKFSDSSNMSDWAVKYFESAVYYGIITGNAGQLLARDKITVQEALYVLERIKLTFDQNYAFNVNAFEFPEDIDLSKIFQKTIGFEYEPDLYKPNATPIDISGITKTAVTGNKFIILKVVSDVDTVNGANEYYWWETNQGYFKQSPGSLNHQEVYFYPTASKPLADYKITVNGADNLGFISHKTLVISKDELVSEQDLKVVPDQDISFNALAFTHTPTLTASKAFKLDFNATQVKKLNIDLGVDHVIVELNHPGGVVPLYSGTPDQKQVVFIAPDIPELYDSPASLMVTVFTQNIKQQKLVSIKYLPVFKVSGKVYNSGVGADVQYVMLGSQKTYLDKNNEFYREFDNAAEIVAKQVLAYSGVESNAFEPLSINLTYDVPKQFVVFFGENKVLDSDQDGVIDTEDAFPYDPTETQDSNLNGIGDNAEANDIIAPVIHVASNIEIKLNQGDSLSATDSRVVDFLAAVTATDNVDRQVSVNYSAPSIFNIGTTSITFTARDVAGNVVNFISSITVSSLDRDSDNLPDTWELRYGLNPQNSSDALLDLDNDGATNLAEFNAHSNPSINESAIAIQPVLQLLDNRKKGFPRMPAYLIPHPQ